MTAYFGCKPLLLRKIMTYLKKKSRLTSCQQPR